MGDKARFTGLIARVAAEQHGHITRRQLFDLGLGRRAIAQRLASGDLVRVHAGVYAVGYVRVEPVARAMAAVLACGRCPRLRDLIDPKQNPTRSGLEDTLIPWLKKHGLPLPILNAQVNGYEVDALYPDHKVIVELDSWEYHHDHPQFLSDRVRDAHHLSYGYPTVRITEDRLTDHEAERLRITLERHSQ